MGQGVLLKGELCILVAKIDIGTIDQLEFTNIFKVCFYNKNHNYCIYS